MDAPQCMRGTFDALLYAGHCTIAVQLAAAETAQLRQLVDAALAEVAALSAQASAILAVVCRCFRPVRSGRSRQPARSTALHRSRPRTAHRTVGSLQQAACGTQRIRVHAAHSCDMSQTRCNMQNTARNMQDATQSAMAAECPDCQAVRRAEFDTEAKYVRYVSTRALS